MKYIETEKATYRVSESQAQKMKEKLSLTNKVVRVVKNIGKKRCCGR